MHENRTDRRKLDSNAAYLAKLDRIVIRTRRDGPESKATLIRIAADAGQSLQGYILQAIRERIDRETEGR